MVSTVDSVSYKANGSCSIDENARIRADHLDVINQARDEINDCERVSSGCGWCFEPRKKRHFMWLGDDDPETVAVHYGSSVDKNLDFLAIKLLDVARRNGVPANWTNRTDDCVHLGVN
jgi:hypothetical protein